MFRDRASNPSWLGSLRVQLGDSQRTHLLAMMGLFFLVVCAVGILRPIKNSLALDGLGAHDFYKVYLVSAGVVVFVPIFNRLSEMLSWRSLFAAIALFFAINLVLFRIWYAEGSGLFGLVFYGWYDLFTAALVTQFFMATQLYFDARSAKRAYPIVIGAASVGAALGGGITGLFAQTLGTPNLLLVAAALVGLFAAGIPWVLGDSAGSLLGAARAAPRQGPRAAGGQPATAARHTGTGRATLRELFADRQVRLIAGTVLLTIVVKQLVDYQFNAITKDVFVTLDAVSAFQGKFNAATQWLPLVVLVGLRPALRRWGIGAAVMLLPVVMLGSTVALAVTFGLWAAVAAKGAETSMRYSAERAGREMLYVPVRDEIKLKAKAYIDVAIEKGAGKVTGALLIMALLMIMDYRQMAWVTAMLAAVWVGLAIAVRQQYVRTLAQSIEGRFASLRGVGATLVDASTLPVVQRALAGPAPLRVAFALELLEQLPPRDLVTVLPQLNDLLEHAEPEIRAHALVLIARAADAGDAAAAAGVDADRLRARLLDPVQAVREAAARALLAASGADAPNVLRLLLHSDQPAVRTAALSCVTVAGSVPASSTGRSAVVGLRRGKAQRPAAAPVRELALVAETMLRAGAAEDFVEPFIDDEDPRVRGAALRSAALLGRVEYCGRMIAALGEPAVREAARDALSIAGEPAARLLAAALLDDATPARIRRAIPATLSRFPTQANINAMLRLVLAPETDQILDYRTLKALSKLRARHPVLSFDPGLVRVVAERECDQAELYAAVRLALPSLAHHGPLKELLSRALDDAFEERREGVFRCLGLMYEPEPVRRAYEAVTSGAPAERAKAVEWLEETIGVELFRRLSAVLEPDRRLLCPRPAGELVQDGDAWVALLARLLTSGTENRMHLVEKVFLLQDVDLLRGARGSHVALLASIAEEVDVAAGAELICEGDVPAAMYVVMSGSVELHGVGHRLVLGPEQAFGTWALIDEQPSPIRARALEPSRLLRVTREDFHDLLADHSELALGLLRGLAHRVRSLVA
jgi:ATP:ADP antiporter, AAA family